MASAWECELDLDCPVKGNIKAPGYVIPYRGGHVILGWHNTQLRTFADSGFNHIEFRSQPFDIDKGIVGEVGRRILVLMADNETSQTLMDELFERDFPYRFDPLVDTATYDYYQKLGQRLLEDYLDEDIGD